MQDYERTKALFRLAIHSTVLAEAKKTQTQITDLQRQIEAIVSSSATRITKLQSEGQKTIAQLQDIMQRDSEDNRHSPGRQDKIMQWLVATTNDSSVKKKLQNLVELHARASSLFEQAETLIEEGKTNEAIPVLCESTVSWRKLMFRPELLLALQRLGHAQHSAAQHAPAGETFAECSKIARQLNDKVSLADSLYKQSLALSYVTEPNSEVIQESVCLYRELGLKLELVQALNHQGRCYKKQGENQLAITSFEESLSLYEELDLEAAKTLSSLGLVYLDEGDCNAAITAFTKCISIRRQFEQKEGLALALNNLGLALVHTGQNDDAIKAYKESADLRRELGQQVLLMKCLITLTRLLHSLGRQSEALPLLAELKRLKANTL